MKLDNSIVIGVLLEYIFFLLYTNVMFARKRRRIFCYSVIGAGYFIRMMACVSGNIYIYMLIFFLINLAALIICFDIGKKTAVFQSAILSVAMVSSEMVIVAISNISIHEVSKMTSFQAVTLTAASRPIYLLELIVLTNVFKKGENIINITSWLIMAIPFFTIVIIILVLWSAADNFVCASVCFAAVVIDVMVFIINQKMAALKIENAALKIRIQNSNSEFHEYEKLKTIRHDIRAHMTAVYSLLDDGSEKAKEYINKLYFQSDGIKFIEYSDNDMFNILISKKKQECSEKNISLVLEPVQASLAFISDVDIVSIFSNLINNAIESCMKSEEKKIYIDIYEANDSFVVIKIENSADTAPVIIDGKIVTSKKDGAHGIGIKSVKNALEKYNGIYEWEYVNGKFLTYIKLNLMKDNKE